MIAYSSPQAFAKQVEELGYYGGIRLIKAGLKVFLEYFSEKEGAYPRQNCRISYTSDIPNRLGLAGSSAILTALMKALTQFYALPIEAPILANLALAAEKSELGIEAGLQDRVVQAFDLPVYMDFD